MPGFRQEKGVDPESQTDTYAAVTFFVENWRWAGVPFYIRTGKRLAAHETELRLVFKDPPRLGFLQEGHRLPAPSQLVVRLDPHPGVRLLLDAHRVDRPGLSEIELDMTFEHEGGEGATPYEVLLSAALRGDSSPFTRQDSIEETWRIVQPLLDEPGPVESYEPGGWGPAKADRLVRWQAPWLAE
jgi:glucose-6-phosphate 1-dehydrogenase